MLGNKTQRSAGHDLCPQELTFLWGNRHKQTVFSEHSVEVRRQVLWSQGWRLLAKVPLGGDTGNVMVIAGRMLFIQRLRGNAEPGGRPGRRASRVPWKNTGPDPRPGSPWLVIWIVLGQSLSVLILVGYNEGGHTDFRYSLISSSRRSLGLQVCSKFSDIHHDNMSRPPHSHHVQRERFLGGFSEKPLFHPKSTFRAQA